MEESTNTGQQFPTTNNQSVEDGKTIAIISYITLIGLIIALVMNGEKKNPFAKFHIRQSLGLMLTSLATSIIGIIPFIGWIISIVAFFLLLYMWIMGLMNAINGKEKELPVLGAKYSEWFKTV